MATRANHISIKDKKAFYKRARNVISQVAELIEYHEFPENPSGFGWAEYQLLSKRYGKVRISVDHVEKRSRLLGTVFTRMEKPKVGVEDGIDCNPHSGKWNMHFSDESLDQAISELERRLGVLVG